MPSTCTVQAPQAATPQPNLVPVSPSVSRSAQRSGVSGSRSSAWTLPLTVTVMAIGWLLRSGTYRPASAPRWRRAGSWSFSTQVSLLPPPCDELTTSDPLRRATRVSPPGTMVTRSPVRM